MTDRPVTSVEEIELIDFLRVVWKWKYLIVVGTLLFSVMVGIISLRMTKIYRVDLVLRPGILRISDNGRNTYIDSPTNIKALIETGIFNRGILASVKSGNEGNLPKSLSFGINIPKNSDALKISYDTAEIEAGKRILSVLAELMIDRYSKIVDYYRSDYQKEINIKETEISNFKASAQSSKEKIKNIQVRINELKSEVQFINNNTGTLMKERDKLIADKETNNILSSILYTNTIQQNLTLANTYKNDINTYNGYMHEEKVALEEHLNKVLALQAEIKNLEFKKGSIQNIQVIQPPTPSTFPIKPNKKRNVIFATMLGLFTMVFLAFFLEYIARHKTIKKD